MEKKVFAYFTDGKFLEVRVKHNLADVPPCWTPTSTKKLWSKIELTVRPMKTHELGLLEISLILRDVA